MAGKTKWKSQNDKFVMYLDIMGFKDKIKGTRFSELQLQFNNLSDNWRRRISPLLKGGHLKHFQFSDSIILFTDKSDDKSLNLIIRAGIIIMQEAMELGFPINGALAKGEMSVDEEKQIFFGKALVYAYQLQISLFYYGIAVHPTAIPNIKRAEKPAGLFSKQSVPLKGGSAALFQLNWNHIKNNYDRGDITEKAKQWINRIEENTQTVGNPLIYIENTRRVLEKIVFVQ